MPTNTRFTINHNIGSGLGYYNTGIHDNASGITTLSSTGVWLFAVSFQIANPDDINSSLNSYSYRVSANGTTLGNLHFYGDDRFDQFGGRDATRSFSFIRRLPAGTTINTAIVVEEPLGGNSTVIVVSTFNVQRIR